MGIARGGTVIRTGGNLSIAGVRPAGVAVGGQVVYRKPATTLWVLLTSGIAIAASPVIDTTGATLLLVSISGNGNSGVFGDNRGNSNWQQLVNPAGNVSISYHTEPFYSGPGHTVTPTGSYPVVIFCAFAGPYVLSDQAQGIGAGATLRPGPITPIRANALLLTAATNNAGTLSVSGGFDMIGVRAYSAGTNYGGALAWKVQTTQEAADPIWSATTPTGAILASFVTP